MLATRIRDGLAELALVAAGLFLGAAVLMLVGNLGFWSTLSAFSGPAVTGFAALFYGLVTVRLVAIRSLEEVPPPVKSSLPRTAGWAFLGFGLAIGGSVVIGYGLQRFGLEVEEQQRIVDIVHRGIDGDRLPLILLGISAIACAPVAEEWLFRGLLFRRLRGVAGRRFAYVASALAFAAIHGNPGGLLIYSWLGVVFAFTFERTGRVWSSMLVHMGNNAFAFAALVLRGA